jgi:hypothetical protein
METALTTLIYAGVACLVVLTVIAGVAILYVARGFQRFDRDRARVTKNIADIRGHIALGARSKSRLG